MWLDQWVTECQLGLFESLLCSVRVCAKSHGCLRQYSPALTSHTCSVIQGPSLSLLLCLHICVFSSGLYFIILTFSFIFSSLNFSAASSVSFCAFHPILHTSLFLASFPHRLWPFNRLFLSVECARSHIFVMLIGHWLSSCTERHHTYL